MTLICAICGAGFDIEAGRCVKCGCERKLVAIREHLNVEDWADWIGRAETDPDFRRRFGLRIEETAEFKGDAGESCRERCIVDTVHGIRLKVLEIKDRAGDWWISDLHEEGLENRD